MSDRFDSTISGELTHVFSGDDRVRLLIDLGLALTAERDMDRLLEKFLRGCRQLTQADAGSIYLVNRKDGEPRDITFAAAQCDSLKVPFRSVRLPLSRAFVAGYVGLTGELLNIPDAYRLPPERPYHFDPKFDRAAGYRTRSMLVVPMRDHRGRIIGVVQLINRKTQWNRKLRTPEDFEQFVTVFDTASEAFAQAVASQAAIAWENARLIAAMEQLFAGLVDASVAAIESRDPTTSGHSLRVTEFAMALAQEWNRSRDGRPGTLSEDDLREFRIASLLHDFGKIGVPEAVLRKATRLNEVQLELVRTRFALLRRLARAGGDEETVERLQRGWEVITVLNSKGWLAEEEASVVRGLLEVSVDLDGATLSALTAEEAEHLLIPRGNLTNQERRQMDDHVAHTHAFLSTIPWPEELRRVPEVAAGHHEKLDGSGYPWGLRGDELLLQQQILAVADIAEALTAKDRPYRKPIPPERVAEILRDEAARGKLSRELVELFVTRLLLAVPDPPAPA
ncbi:MAG: GAF domain-containing protein [Deltaproteobacteria bacterium]|nr:GAF domain-containing protein [Deltaproteobacteria bacterium]